MPAGSPGGEVQGEDEWLALIQEIAKARPMSSQDFKALYWFVVVAFVFLVAATLYLFLQLRLVAWPFLVLISALGFVIVLEMIRPWLRKGGMGVRFPDEGLKRGSGAKPARN